MTVCNGVKKFFRVISKIDKLLISMSVCGGFSDSHEKTNNNNIMVARKSAEKLQQSKRRVVKKTSIEVNPSTRVLRSHKRKLAEQNENNDIHLVENKRKKSSVGRVSDCIILSDSETVTARGNVNKAITSTPLRSNSREIPNFDESCIKHNENKEPDKDPVDVIVLSDSSTATLPIIVLSDEDEPEIEVMPSSQPKKSPNHSKINPKEIKKKEVLMDVVNNKKPETNVPKVSPEKPNKMKFKSKKHRLDKKRYKPGYQPRKQKSKTGNPNFGENIYVENPVALPTTGLRPVIIDGSNVAFHHSNNSYFSCKGLEICIKYFKIRGHEVIAFVPHYRLKYKESDNPKLLDLLVKSGDVVLTPSRMVNGSMVVSYDDRFIVQTAVVKGGVIVTRDNYRDLLEENPLWAETIKYRLLQFTWVQDLLMFPNDPLGKRGPSLEEFLRFG